MYNETILLGVVVSLILTELTGLSAGLIIPGYLALAIHSPVRIATTLLIAAAAVGICRFMARYVILYGRRRFALLMLLTWALGGALSAAGLLPASLIGLVLPGLIAREFDTLLAMAVTGGLTALLVFVLGNTLPGL